MDDNGQEDDFDQHELDPLDSYREWVRTASEGEPAICIEERIRFIEVLWFHARSGWADTRFVLRALNFICNPETWEEWKAGGGDPGDFFDDDDTGQ